MRLLFECRVSGPLVYFTSRRGETLKGLISREMKKLFPCSPNLKCDNCSMLEDPADCEYVRFFRFDLSRNPFTYVIVPPMNPRSVYHENDKFSFEVRLIGECASFEYLVKYLAPAIEQGGLLSGIGTWYKEKHFGRFNLSSIYAWQNQAWETIFQEDSGFLLESFYPESFQKQCFSNVAEYSKIRFYTPFCLKRNKKILSEPTIEDILYFSLMRLRSIYNDNALKITDEIYQSIGQCKTTTCQCERTGSKKDTNYFIGEINFENLPQKLVPLLKLGSLSHIGKSTTQGYGGFFIVQQ